jgi:ABC-type multidrug transport system permease subunit
MVFLTVCFYTFMGQALSYLTASMQSGTILASGLNFMFNVFNGFTRPYPSMPKGWQWFNRCAQIPAFASIVETRV